LISGTEKVDSARPIIRTVKKITDGSIQQCNKARIEDCWKIELDLEQLGNMRTGDTVMFSDQTDFKLKLRQNPTVSSSGSKNYQFLTVEMGLEASLTVRKKGPGDVSLYGVARTPEKIYTLEYCRSGCNVLYSISADAFNDFMD